MDKKEQQKDKYLHKTYGLTLLEWKELSKNGCWICGRKEGRLNVDHRHVKNYKKMTPEQKRKEVRSCLCFMCNTMLHGVEKRNRARYFLERMVAYFAVFKIKGDI
jgi:hypothetical protein